MKKLGMVSGGAGVVDVYDEKVVVIAPAELKGSTLEPDDVGETYVTESLETFPPASDEGVRRGLYYEINRIRGRTPPKTTEEGS